jgi:hypothetical protein
MIAATLLAAGVAALASGPNLRIAALDTQARAASPGELRLPTTIRNSGNRRAGASRTRFVFSRDRALGSDVRLASMPEARLRAGRSRTTTALLRVPAGLKSGAWYVIACADARSSVRERDERDNCRAARGAIAVQPQTLPEIPSLP